MKTKYIGMYYYFVLYQYNIVSKAKFNRHIDLNKKRFPSFQTL